MEATLTFENREDAEAFAKSWSRKSLTGHTITAGLKNVQVTVWNVTDELRQWIDDYVNNDICEFCDGAGELSYDNSDGVAVEHGCIYCGGTGKHNP